MQAVHINIQPDHLITDRFHVITQAELLAKNKY
jgi:hypothetical protein